MKIDRLFQVLVITGASSTVGLAACGSDKGGSSDAGTGGATSSGGSTGAETGGSTSSAGTSGSDGSMCSCKAETTVPTWIDCGGCCCWLAAGQTSPAPTPICGAQPCCIGHGRTTASQ